MDTYGSPEGYLFNLHTCSSSEAKRMWKTAIKNQWNNKCAYCGSDTNLTLDHIVPRSKGGSNHTTNVLCAIYLFKSNQRKFLMVAAELEHTDSYPLHTFIWTPILI